MVVALAGCGGGGGGIAPETPGGSLGGPIVGVWQAQSAEVNGQVVPVAEATGLDPSAEKVLSVFWHDGTRTMYGFRGNTPVDNRRATWTVSGSTLAVSTAGCIVNYRCTMLDDRLTMTHQQGGDTVAVTWEKVQEGAGAGTGGGEGNTAIGVALMGTWQAVSATLNGQPVCVGEAPVCGPSTDGVVMVIHSFGTLTQYAYADSRMVATTEAMWTATDTAMTIYWADRVETFGFAVASTQLTTTYRIGGNSIVVVWAKVN